MDKHRLLARAGCKGYSHSVLSNTNDGTFAGFQPVLQLLVELAPLRSPPSARISVNLQACQGFPLSGSESAWSNASESPQSNCWKKAGKSPNKMIVPIAGELKYNYAITILIDMESHR